MTPDPNVLIARAMVGSPAAVDELAAAWEGGAPVAPAVGAFVRRALDAALGLGWTCAEVVRLTGPTRDHATLLVATVLDDAGGAAVDRWRGACPSTAAAAGAAVRALTALGSLPPAPGGHAAGSGGGAGSGRGGDDAVLARVRALLAKAESTTFPAEAEALSAKAHELMARYAIDRALVGGADPTSSVACRRIWIDDPYASAKRLLLAQVASASACRSVWTKGLQLVTVFGMAADLDAVELLHTSLLVQATAAVLGAAADEPGDRTRSRAYRSAFLHAYASRIGERLHEARRIAVEEASAVHGTPLLPVLASHEAAVDGAVRQAFPHLRRGRTLRVSDAAGWRAGHAAGGRADLGQRPVRQAATRSLVGP